MTFNQIEKQWDENLLALALRADKLCEKRLRELVAKLKNITIDHITMGMGSWMMSGPDFKSVYDDDSECDMDLQHIIYWLECVTGVKPGMYVWKPKRLTKSELAVLTELYKLCEWWVDKTGGMDISFKAPATET
mgnify:CR=1 FL=1